MSDATRHPEVDRLMSDLVADLRPVRPLRAPWLRASAWLGVVTLIAGGLALRANLPAVANRLAAAPDMWLALVGSIVTAILAAFATFQLSLPDRHPAWALLPLPSLVVWVGASGLGCARTWLITGTHDASLAESMDCLVFIVALSLPLSVLLFAMLRRGYSMRPALTGSLAGLAAAAAAATLLDFFHPYDAALSDLLVHAATVALVVGTNRLLGGALLRRRR